MFAWKGHVEDAAVNFGPHVKNDPSLSLNVKARAYLNIIVII